MLIKQTASVNKTYVVNQKHSQQQDEVVVEEPLQIQLTFKDNKHSTLDKPFVYAIVMRTPGNDEQLITGLLFSEGIITDIQQIISLTPDLHFEQADGDSFQGLNIWDVELDSQCIDRLHSIQKYQHTYSSCGLCGTTSLKALSHKQPQALSSVERWFSATSINQLKSQLLDKQSIFQKTGGTHAAALLDADGNVLSFKEDIGRHNALDKLIGEYLLGDNESRALNRQEKAVVISSRVSFEMVQKTVMAAIPVLIALGAPSKLAVQAAKQFDLTLIAFVKEGAFNVYHGQWRLNFSE